MAKKRASSPRSRRVAFTPNVAGVLRWERVCRVATAGTSGMPHVVPVCHVFSRDRLYIGSGADARKVMNLKENAQIALTVDVYTEAWSQLRGVMVQGRARLIDRGPEFQRIRDLLYAKYPQYRTEAALSPSDSVVVELVPSHVFAWGLD